MQLISVQRHTRQPLLMQLALTKYAGINKVKILGNGFTITLLNVSAKLFWIILQRPSQLLRDVCIYNYFLSSVSIISTYSRHVCDKYVSCVLLMPTTTNIYC